MVPVDEAADASAARRNWRRTTLRVRSMMRFRLLQQWNRHEGDAIHQQSDATALLKYEPLGVLGVGGTAVVYLVRHRSSQQLFAMKIQACPMQPPWPRRTFHARREHYILKMLHHPFVCQLHEAFHDEKRLYLVLAFEEGGSVDDVRAFCGGTLPEQVVKFYVEEIVQALEYIHTMGFVYRDLKPQNVLVAGDGHVRLADFGVAHEGLPVDPTRYSDTNWMKDISAGLKTSSDETITTTASTSSDDFSVDEEAVEYTNQSEVDEDDDEWDSELETSTSAMGVDDRVRLRSNSLVGAIEYMPPEMIQQVSAQSSDVDWWALGCLVFELLYGVSPFHQSHQNATNLVFRRVLAGQIVFPSSPRVSDNCKDLIRSLLAVDPRQRLGHRQGSSEVKAHKFFEDVQWAYRSSEPPVRVNIRCGRCHVHGHTSSSRIDTLTTSAGESESNKCDDHWKAWTHQIPQPTVDSCECARDRYTLTSQPQSRFEAMIRSQSVRFETFRNRIMKFN